MKRMFIFFAAAFCLALVGPVFAAGGDTLEYFTFSSSGTHAVSFSHKVNEVYIVRSSTNYVRINYTGSLCANTTHYELMPASSGVSTTREDISTTSMSIFTDEVPVDIQIRGKSW